jgi:hypothetical protein
MNNMESNSHTEIAARKERVKEIFLLIGWLIRNLVIVQENRKYICNGVTDFIDCEVVRKNSEIARKGMLTSVAFYHDHLILDLRKNPNSSIYALLGAFVYIYDSRIIQHGELNLQKSYETKIVDIQNTTGEIEQISLICIDVNPASISDRKSPTKRLQEELRIYLNTTLLDSLMKKEWLCRKTQTSTRDILSSQD